MQGKNRFNNSKYQLWFILFMRHLLHKFHKHKHSTHCIILVLKGPSIIIVYYSALRIAMGSASITSLKNFKLLSVCKVINTKAFA